MTVSRSAAGATTQTLAREGGRSFDAYLARPQTARGPAVLVLHDMFGLNEPIRAVADHYAGLGYAALVPNLFWRSKIPEALSYDGDQHPLAWDRLKALDLDVVSADMRVAVGWLRAQPFSAGKVAAIGFCGGGRFAFLAAVRCGVDAAVSLYGLGISEHVGEIGNARGPLQLHYGLQDQHIPRREIDAVAEGVRGCPLAEVFLYPQAGHSFANPVRPTYDPAATQLAASRIERMLEEMSC
ncbi:MAG: dienelactone hydrolase family protein [Xanthobacteraceae bacterium]|nr:dienelactone hydrolase family protein [Xanthobacteraceae bacterium]